MEVTPEKQEFYDKIGEAIKLKGEDRTSALKTLWGAEAAKILEGRTIVLVRYMTRKEVEDLDFRRAGIVLMLDDGTCIFPSMDDEGNDSGALFTTSNHLHTIPVI